MAKNVNVNTASNNGATQVHVDSQTGNINIVVSRAVVGSISNVENANTANFAGVANVANSVDISNVVGLGNIASINLDGNADNILYGNGVFAEAPDVANANFANFAGTAFAVDASNIVGVVSNANYAAFANVANSANSVDGANVSGEVANANFASFANVATTANSANSVAGANVVGEVSVANTVSNPNQSNITQVGNLNSLTVSTDATVAGNLTVGGNLQYSNITQLYVTDPIIELGGAPNNQPLTANDGKDRGTLLHYYDTQPIDAFMGWDNSNGEFAFGSNVTNANDVVTFNQLGNVRADTFIGDLQGNATSADVAGSANSVAGANVTGEVQVANTVSNPNQSNITQVGTLSNLDVAGNITADKIIANDIEANISFTEVDYIDFDTAATVTDQQGRLYWNAGDGTLDIGMNANVVQQVGQETYFYARALENITNGQVVQFAGSQGDKIEFVSANTASANFEPRLVMGVATENINSGELGYVTAFGMVNDLATNAFPEGSTLYLEPNSAGVLTTVEPTPPDPKIVVAACVTQATAPNATNGRIQVRPDFGYYMNELHDVSNTASADDVLVYDGNVWQASNTVPVANTASSIENGNSTVEFTGADGNLIVTVDGQESLTVSQTEVNANANIISQSALGIVTLGASTYNQKDDLADSTNCFVPASGNTYVYFIVPNTSPGFFTQGEQISFEDVDGPGNANLNGGTFYVDSANVVFNNHYPFFLDDALTQPATFSGLGVVDGQTGNGNVLFDFSAGSNVEWNITSNASNLLFEESGNTKVTFTNNGDIVANNIGNIASIDLDGSNSNVLYGNGVFDQIQTPTPNRIEDTTQIGNTTFTGNVEFSGFQGFQGDFFTLNTNLDGSTVAQFLVGDSNSGVAPIATYNARFIADTFNLGSLGFAGPAQRPVFETRGIVDDTSNNLVGFRFNAARPDANSFNGLTAVQQGDGVGSLEWRPAALAEFEGNTFADVNTSPPFAAINGIVDVYSGNVNELPEVGLSFDVVGDNTNVTTHRMYSNGSVEFNGDISATNLGNIASIDLDGSSSNVLYGNGVFDEIPAPNKIEDTITGSNVTVNANVEFNVTPQFQGDFFDLDTNINNTTVATFSVPEPNIGATPVSTFNSKALIQQFEPLEFVGGFQRPILEMRGAVDPTTNDLAGFRFLSFGYANGSIDILNEGDGLGSFEWQPVVNGGNGSVQQDSAPFPSINAIVDVYDQNVFEKPQTGLQFKVIDANVQEINHRMYSNGTVQFSGNTFTDSQLGIFAQGTPSQYNEQKALADPSNCFVPAAGNDDVYFIVPNTSPGFFTQGEQISFEDVVGPGNANVNGETFFVDSANVLFNNHYPFFLDSGLTQPATFTNLGVVDQQTGGGNVLYDFTQGIAGKDWKLDSDGANLFLTESDNTKVTFTENSGTTFEESVTVSSGGLDVTGDVTVQTGFFTNPALPGSVLNTITGSVGQMAAVSDNGGKLAYWDTTNSRWSYVSDDSAV